MEKNTYNYKCLTLNISTDYIERGCNIKYI